MNNNQAFPTPHSLAAALRSLALFAILYQLRLVADDLADTAVFCATLVAAFGAAVFLAYINGKKVPPVAAMVTIALVPWLVRLFIAIPRWFIPGNTGPAAAGLDALLLSFDRNNFVSLLPFYYAAATTWCAIRRRLFLRAAVVADAALLVAVLGIAPVSDVAMYRWPIVMVFFLAGIIFMQVLALLFSLPPQIRLGKGEKTAAIAVMLILTLTGGLIFLRSSQERAAQRGGGLLEPRLFSFDFSQILRLDTEISMSDDLILIVRKDPHDYNILMRRSVMSGYNKRQGFFRIEELDERTHPHRQPPRPVHLSPPDFNMARQVSQEYFLVNFDAAAFIGMKEPLEIIPYESWDASSFRAAYAVESMVSDASLIDLLQSVTNDGEFFWPTPHELGLSEQEFAIYTSYGDDEPLRLLAEEWTEDLDNYFDKVQAIHDQLKFGMYRYSLRPGIAPDGDQLAWFLFHSHKGYCSYFAFAMTLLLRSIGIPARVTAGFFLDPESATFDYFPVRADMAHAWVEVPFPGLGWIEFDPTTENLAEGEEFRFSAGVDPQLLERLMREILENRSLLRPKMGQDGSNVFTDAQSLARLSVMLIRKVLLPLLILAVVTVFVLSRCGWFLRYFMHKNHRAKAVCLWKHARRRLHLAGITPARTLFESEWAVHCDKLVKGTYSLYLGSAAARFSPQYNDSDAQRTAYDLFADSYREAIPRRRRLLAWIAGPLAQFIRPLRIGLMILVLFICTTGTNSRAQDDAADIHDADQLFISALESEYAEHWERAINLYREGRARHPEDPRFPLSLGNLFFSRALYGLARDEFLAAEQIRPDDTFILHRLASTASFLNQDRDAVDYLERLLAIDPWNKEAIGNLGWTYYKVHRLEDGERLLLNALEHFGEDPDLAMTLATVYSDMYNYDEGRHWYLRAIALAGPARSFTAVAYYNLSILESRFYQYGLAMNAANASLAAQYRASGLLARGELQTRRMDLVNAQSDFDAARDIDRSPLAKLNLAQTYQISGRLEEALLYALDCLRDDDHTWMAHFGIDPIRYKRDIHEILYETYSALANTQMFIPWGTFSGNIRSMVQLISYRFHRTVHRKLYQKYSLAAGDAYRAETASAPPLDQAVQYFKAFKSYPRRAMTWLNKARDFITEIIPASDPSYYLEEGILTKNRSLTAQALDMLDPVWEKDLIALSYREFALHGTKNERPAAASELFSLNRGALLQAGISLPVDIRLHNDRGPDGSGFHRERMLRRMLARAGFSPAPGDTRFVLDVSISAASSGAYSITVDLIDTEGALDTGTLRRTIHLPSRSRADIAGFARSVSSAIFRVE